MRKFFRDMGNYGIVTWPVALGVYRVSRYGDAVGTWALVCIIWWKFLDKFEKG